MRRYIKIFSDESEYAVAAEANAWAERHKETIISASLEIRAFSHIRDQYHLTVVFEKEE